MTATGDAPALPHPPAERLDRTEELHGHRVADPYRRPADTGLRREGVDAA